MARDGDADAAAACRWRSAALRRVCELSSEMRDVVRIGQRAGAKVVLVTVPVNVRDFAPFAGDEAMKRFRNAQVLLARGDTAAAGEFAAARDLDLLRFRTDSRLNAITREVAASTGLRWRTPSGSLESRVTTCFTSTCTSRRRVRTSSRGSSLPGSAPPVNRTCGGRSL